MIGKNQRNSIVLFGLKMVHLLFCVILFYFFWILFRYGGYTKEGTGFRYNYYVTAGYGVVLVLFIRTYNAYLFGYSRTASLVFSQFLTQFFSIVIVWGLVSIAWRQLYSPLIFSAFLAIEIVWDIIWSSLVNWLFFKLFRPKKTILIYRNKLDKQRFGLITGKSIGRVYNIVKELQYDGVYKEVEPELAKYEAIFVAGVNSRCRNGILKYCKEKDVPGFFLPHVGDVIMQEAQHIQSFDSPILYVNKKVLTPEYMVAKRSFDFVMSLIGLIVLSPIMILTSLAIKIYDRGPVIYKQVRLTKDEKKFKILKFRSMRVDAEKDGIARLSSGEEDERITPVGRFVRKCRLDELPQLFNILKGEMSFVGPRPERPEIAEQYYKSMPDFKLRLQVKAGLTGYAQVYGKYNTDPYNKLELDLLYIKNMGILTDLRLLFATVEILFIPESTEGIQNGQITAMDRGTGNIESEKVDSEKEKI